MSEWYGIDGLEFISTPALAIYKSVMEKNIASLIAMAENISSLRPHVKTNKIKEVCIAMMQKGISKFKCATVAELQMLCEAGAKDVLFAYPLSGANINFIIALQQKYSSVSIAFITDNLAMIPLLNAAFSNQKLCGNVFIDVNVGMNRTGCRTDEIEALADAVESSSNLRLAGFHAYDGHIHDGSPRERCKSSISAVKPVFEFREEAQKKYGRRLQITVAGSPTFSYYLGRNDVEVSPGTFVFWDYGYKTHYPELPFDYAALLICRVVSVIAAKTLCLDAGYKSVASEMPLPRMHFLNIQNVETLFQSEEHLVIKTDDAQKFKPGDIVYAVPIHICPTVALYDEALVIEDNYITGHWKISARNRSFRL